MKAYGKRLIPRNPTEFIDLVVPFIESQPNHAKEILYSYSKRKKRNPLKDFETAPLLLFLAFEKQCDISIQTVCQYLYSFIEGVPEELEEDVMSRADQILIGQYGNAQTLLKKYLESIILSPYRCEIEVTYHPIEKLSHLVSDYGSFSRSWQYGIVHNRADICGRFLLNTELVEILTSAHIDVRKSRGLKPVLSKWKSEQLLFDKIKIAFPELVVIGQGSPAWLEGQRFDVWLPQINVAIEYNGAQHFTPIDFFGGHDGHKRTKERDELKRAKCLENNTSLIEVEEGYDFELIRQEISRIKSIGSLPKSV